MNNNDLTKLILAILLMGFTAGWAFWTVEITVVALAKLNVTNVITAAGSNQVMGALLTLDTLVFQHYFRKAKPE